MMGKRAAILRCPQDSLELAWLDGCLPLAPVLLVYCSTMLGSGSSHRAISVLAVAKTPSTHSVSWREHACEERVPDFVGR